VAVASAGPYANMHMAQLMPLPLTVSNLHLTPDR